MDETHLSMQAHMSKYWPVQWASGLPSMRFAQAFKERGERMKV